MNSEDIEPFIGKEITLVLTGNFRLTGVILKATYDSILFETPQKKALINIAKIEQIVGDF